MTLFPTEQWLAEYGRLLDESDALDDVSVGWGVGFDGDIRLVIDDVPLAETTLDELPPRVLADLPEHVRAGVGEVTLADAPDRFDEHVRPSLPDVVQDLLRQIEENVHDGAIHAHVGLREGSVTAVETLTDPDARDAGFVIHGSLTTWQGILDGRPAVSALMTGDLTVQGNQVRLLRYSSMLGLLGEVAADVGTTHLFAEPGPSVTRDVVDAATRPGVAVQRTAERQVTRTLRDLSLL
ncbi:SCP2 sterol-binding domain-containing protein [Haloglomus litoreum]|uniref:SCP2 sterol-binding domain-containing protein n=1 Tax=Haloglomus litoreum TaxID=3034026 RepID=UPI0023E773ED|nr:SCP2 sterol-binding domain-containing protein [Haloglomus sp. DT116]